MIKVTPAAAAQIKLSAEQGKTEGMSLRIAASRNDDNSIHYGMGFDDSQIEGDLHVTSGGINVVISETSKILLEGTTLDYVELEPGEYQFIFMNPNDANYTPPA